MVLTKDLINLIKNKEVIKMIKKVAGSLYAHKSNIKELKSKLSKKQLDLFNNLWHKINEDN